MTTKQRIRNKYRIELRERDHLPAHVHLAGAGVDVMIFLDSLESVGAWPADVKNEVLAWIEANREDLLKEWKKWHP